jgi:hypothetical protein
MITKGQLETSNGVISTPTHHIKVKEALDSSSL